MTVGWKAAITASSPSGLMILCLLIHSLEAVTLFWTPTGQVEEEAKELNASYKDIVQIILNESVAGGGRHQSYDRLAVFTDKFGNRIAGSKNLENSIDYLLAKMKDEGLENVHGETVMIDPWIRNDESLQMITPRPQPLAILGLGSSVPTPKDGLTGLVLVVKSFNELRKRASEAKGKIVVFNQDFVSYPVTAKYRTQGASEAAKVGAIATLIRTVAPLSIYSPHTGMQFYATKKKIPAASITIEDAEMMQRMQDRGQKITLHLTMNCETAKPRVSRNIIAEIKGSTHPEQVILFGGHIDSWDVGKGAMDDGGGAFISWQVLSLIKQLNLRPKRTLRMIMWTGEEYGGVGGQAYFKKHKNDVKNFKFVMESDMGTFKPTGIIYYGDKKTAKTVRDIAKLMTPIDATKFVKADDVSGIGEDVTNWLKAGVPGASLLNRNERYFYFHHSQGDTMTVQNAGEMDQCAGLWASLAYVIADVDQSYLGP